jgi:zinc transport system ATP-binding protein
MNPIIKCEHTDFGYENHDAVIDLNLEIYPGDYLCVVGENGSGKSTLIKGMLGLLKPTGGSLSVADELKRGGIGYLPQQTAAQKDFPATVLVVVLSGTLSRRGNRPFYSRAERKLAAHNLERLGIEHLKQKCYRELSGGQQQRVLIARALCATEQLLILDEPITGLDPSAIQDFYHLIKKLNKEDGITIIMVSHDIGNVISQANKILHLHRRVVFCGTAEAYRQSVAGKEFLGGDEV